MGGSSSLYEQPWRTLPEDHNGICDFLKSYTPQDKNIVSLRILLHGSIGAGKSSFVNSVESVILGRVCGRTLTDAASAGSSFTKKYGTYKINKGNKRHCSFVFTDTMGLESGAEGVQIEDIKLALSGHVEEGYKFSPDSPLTEGKIGYKSSPSLSDKVHVLVFVVSAVSLSIMSENIIKEMRDVRLAASEMDIPQLVILTKVDEACPEAKKDVNNTYKSKYLKEQVDKIHTLLGVPLNCIFLVKNYISEMETNEKVDAHILLALRQMIQFGEDFLNNLNFVGLSGMNKKIKAHCVHNY